MKTYDVHAVMLDEQMTAVADAELPVADIGPWLAKAYHAVYAACRAQGLQRTGAPFARYRLRGRDTCTIEAGFPVEGPIKRTGDVRPSSLPEGAAASVVHIGPYETMEQTYEALVAWIERRGGAPVGDAWEIYLSDPRMEPDSATWRTEILQPYRPA